MSNQSSKDNSSTPALRVIQSQFDDTSSISPIPTMPALEHLVEESEKVQRSSNKKIDQKSHKKSGRIKIKGTRGVDTLLRNAYRTQLDMLALAATKANIMISLNGLLMSILFITGTHFITISGLYIIPTSLFLITCAMATVFAVSAARPDISQGSYSLADFDIDRAQLLVFEEFSDLDEAQYVEAMTKMLTKPQRVYRNMIAHLHTLGSIADRKYRQLYYSYTVFMSGVILSVVTLLVLEGLKFFGLLPIA